MKLYEKPEDLRIYAIVETSKRGKMGIVMSGTNRNMIKAALGRMQIVRSKRSSTLTLATFSIALCRCPTGAQKEPQG